MTPEAKHRKNLETIGDRYSCKVKREEKIRKEFKMESQLEKIHSHLVHHGSITSWDAIIEYRITRLSEYIRQLRADYGMDIVSTRESKDCKWWVRYSYERKVNFLKKRGPDEKD